MTQIIQSGITDSIIFALLATSFFLIFNVGKMLHFAHGTAYLLGAYTAYTVYPHVPFPITVLAAIGVGAVFGFLCERVVYSPLRSRGATGMILLISSLALFIVGENAIGMKYGSQTINLTSGLQESAFTVGDLVFSWIHVVGFVGTVLWIAFLAFVLARTGLGYYIRAIATQEQLAELTGISAARVRRIVFFGASAAVGFAGLVRLVDLNGEPTMGFTGILFAIVPFIVGGSGSIWGPVLGAAILGFGINVFAWYVGSEWTLAFVFALLAVIVLVRPQGLIPART